MTYRVVPHGITEVRAHARRGRPVRRYVRLRDRPGSVVTGRSMQLPGVMAYVESLTDPSTIHLTKLSDEEFEGVPIEQTLAHETAHQVLVRDEGLRASHGMDYLRHGPRGERPIYPAHIREDLGAPSRVGRLSERQLAFLGAAGRKRLRERP